MFHDILKPAEKLQYQAIKAATKVNGLYCDLYDRLEETPYDNARGEQATNINKYSDTPTIRNLKLLVHLPMQMSRPGYYDSNSALFDSYMTEQMFIVTEKLYPFKLYQKVIVKYGGKNSYNTRQFVIYKINTMDNTQGKPILTYAYLSPLT